MSYESERWTSIFLRSNDEISGNDDRHLFVIYIKFQLELCGFDVVLRLYAAIYVMKMLLFFILKNCKALIHRKVFRKKTMYELIESFALLTLLFITGIRFAVTVGCVLYFPFSFFACQIPTQTYCSVVTTNTSLFHSPSIHIECTHMYGSLECFYFGFPLHIAVWIFSFTWETSTDGGRINCEAWQKRKNQWTRKILYRTPVNCLTFSQ